MKSCHNLSENAVGVLIMPAKKNILLTEMMHPHVNIMLLLEAKLKFGFKCFFVFSSFLRIHGLVGALKSVALNVRDVFFVGISMNVEGRSENV